MKAGYILELFNKENDKKQPIEYSKEIQLTPSDATAWQCLKVLLNPDTSSVDENDELYQKTKQSMKELADKIKTPSVHFENEPSTSNTNDDWLLSNKIDMKRKLKDKCDTSKCKKFKLDLNSEFKAEPYLDILLDDPNVHKFSKIFSKIQTIQLTEVDFSESSTQTNLNFQFDLYVANSNFKKSDPGQPNYRVIVLEDAVPTRQSIVQLYLTQSFRAPILVIFVNDVKSMQAFLYKFTI